MKSLKQKCPLLIQGMKTIKEDKVEWLIILLYITSNMNELKFIIVVFLNF